jgi:predicted glycosyltransferase
MRILIDIGHPAHVHYYRNMARKLESQGHCIIWTVKNLEIAKQLLNIYGYKYYVLPKKADTLIGKILKQIIYDFIILGICIWKKVDIAIGTSVSIAHISKISNIKSIVFDDDDDEVQPLITNHVTPYATVLLSPDSLKGKRIRNDTIFYPGFHELAYLHTKNFKPDPQVLEDVGINVGETYFIMRFNVFKAHHDVGIAGLSLEQKLILINILRPYGKIFITTERKIEPELERYQMKIGPEKMHSFLFFSTMFLGDSQTMSSEAAVLGVPSLRCNSFAGRISYLEEEEHRYGLTFAFKPENFDSMIVKLKSLLDFPNLRDEWQNRRQVLLSDKIDVTLFWSWFIENYPSSYHKVTDTLEFWMNFK